MGGKSGGHRRRQIRLLQSPGQRSSAQAADDRQGQVLQRLGREEDQGGRRHLHPHRLINNNNNINNHNNSNNEVMNNNIINKIKQYKKKISNEMVTTGDNPGSLLAEFSSSPPKRQ